VAVCKTNLRSAGTLRVVQWVSMHAARLRQLPANLSQVVGPVACPCTRHGQLTANAIGHLTADRSTVALVCQLPSTSDGDGSLPALHTATQERSSKSRALFANELGIRVPLGSARGTRTADCTRAADSCWPAKPAAAGAGKTSRHSRGWNSGDANAFQVRWLASIAARMYISTIASV
jgi:hypothetical protein